MRSKLRESGTKLGMGPYTPKQVAGPKERSFAVIPTGGPAAGGRRKQKFPLITFAHQLGPGQFTSTGYMPFINFLVSHGYVWVAFEDCSACGVLGGMSHKQLSMVTGMKDSPHANIVDFDKIVIAGHSMGAGATVATAVQAKYQATWKGKIKAGLSMNPNLSGGPQSGLSLLMHHDVPIFFSTGYLDPIAPGPLVKPYYRAAPAGSVFVNLFARGHEGPVLTFELFKWQVFFLDCHVKQKKKACTEYEANMCGSLKGSCTMK